MMAEAYQQKHILPQESPALRLFSQSCMLAESLEAATVVTVCQAGFTGLAYQLSMPFQKPFK